MSLAHVPHDVPPPSLGALHRKVSKHGAEARRRAAARRRADEVAEARALGVAVVVKPRVDRTWSEAEDAVVRALYPDTKRARERLPHRSAEGIRHRADALGLMKPAKAWTPAEIATLRRLWARSSAAELRVALPRWSTAAIGRKGLKLGLKPRGQPPLKPTGDPLCDAIRDRCRVLGYSMAYLDRISRSAWRRPMSDRRSFLRGLVSLPLIGGGVTLIGSPVRAAVPVSDDLVARYVAFLAAEHREALITLFDRRRDDFCTRHPPMHWVPDAHRDAAEVARATDPSTRAAVILSAAGVPL